MDSLSHGRTHGEFPVVVNEEFAAREGVAVPFCDEIW
jgi:hypothetical protein